LVNKKNFDKGMILPKLPLVKRSKLLIEWISESWEKINSEMIKNSFIFCGYGNNNNNIKPEWKKYYK